MKRYSINRMMRLLLILCAFFAVGCAKRIGSNEVGVKVVNIGLLRDKGVIPEPYTTGTYFYNPILSEFHVFDKSRQKLEMTKKEGEGARRGRDDIRLKTSDGNDVWVDVTIIYYLDWTQAPQFITEVGRQGVYEENIVRPMARSQVRAVLGELETEDFYNPTKREEQAEVAKDRMNAILEPWGIKINSVLVRNFEFNPEYQEKIEERKQADQEIERNIAETEAARQRINQLVAEARGEANKKVEEAKGYLDKIHLEADALMYAKKQEAEGILAVKKAEAEGLRKLNEALRGAGGPNLVALEIAKALQGKKILLVPTGQRGDVNVTDINALLHDFTSTRAIKKQPKSSVTAPAPKPAPSVPTTRTRTRTRR